MNYFLDSCENLDQSVIIKTANGDQLKASKKGIIRLYSRKNNTEICLTDVLLVKDLKYNLISVKSLEKHDCEIIFKNGEVHIYKDRCLLLGGKSAMGLYSVNLNCLSNKENQDYVCSVIDKEVSDDLWHRRFGHISEKYFQILKSKEMVIGLKEKDLKRNCESCTESKQCKLPFTGTRWKSDRVLELIHTDVCGPINPISSTGERYILSFIDDFSHHLVVYLISNKSEVFSCFKEFESIATSKFGVKIASLRCDNGGEYISNEMKNFSKEKGIQLQYIPSYTPELNGVAERMNRTLLNNVRCLLHDSGVPKVYWKYAVETAVYLINRSPTGEQMVTPAEIWYKKKPIVSNLRIFGCLSYIHQNERGKLDRKSVKGFLFGYCEGGYRIFNINENKVVVSRNVIFDESRTWISTIISEYFTL